MADFTVRLGDLTEATCDNLAAALRKADTWAKPLPRGIHRPSRRQAGGYCHLQAHHLGGRVKSPGLAHDAS